MKEGLWLQSVHYYMYIQYWKIMESRFPGNMHTFTSSLKYHKKIPEIIGNSLRGIVLQKKTELTDWSTDGSNISYPSQLLVLSIIVINKNVFHYQNGLLKLIVREPIKKNTINWILDWLQQCLIFTPILILAYEILCMHSKSIPFNSRHPICVMYCLPGCISILYNWR